MFLLVSISTHALTWSATQRLLITAFIGRISTHALTWSATLGAAAPIATAEFQLTHSRGVRLDGMPPATSGDNFNSRTHVECDLGVNRLDADGEISTHALTWSATALSFIAQILS